MKPEEFKIPEREMIAQFTDAAIHLTRAEDRVKELERELETLRVELEGGAHEGDKGLRRVTSNPASEPETTP